MPCFSALLAAAPAALADGDPASDYLLGGSTYLSPFDSHIPKAEQAKLDRHAREREEAGLPAEGRGDRDAVRPRRRCRVLFKTPQTYAQFLAEEDFYYWKDEVLVVMPNGFGIYKANKAARPPTRRLIAKLKVPPNGDGAGADDGGAERP